MTPTVLIIKNINFGNETKTMRVEHTIEYYQNRNSYQVRGSEIRGRLELFISKDSVG